MRKIIFMLLVFLAFLPNATLLMAQSNASEWDYIYVREDIVKPSLTAAYEASLSDLKVVLTDGKVGDFSYYTHLQDNYHFVHITPLNSLKDIEKGMIKLLSGKVKMDEFNLVWADLTATLAASRNYVLQYHSELSYDPDNIYWGENTPYRRWNYLFLAPGFENNMEKLLKAWKTLYAQKKVTSGFRIFSGVVGVEHPLYIFTTWAEDPLDFQNDLAEATKLLGDEGAALWAETMTYVRDVETVEGWFLPQYSYIPKK